VSGGDERPAALLVGDRVHHGGALLCTLEGECELLTLVAQGCRPVGQQFIVTRSRGNVIQELNAGKPTEVLRKLYDGLDAHDHALFNTSLFIGVERGSKHGRFEHGDFLIRNVLGIDPEAGAMATDVRLGEYQVVQFHLRDRDAAAQDLVRHLRAPALAATASRARGALLFSCVGRGERLYGVPNHDTDAFLKRLGPMSVSGMFCNGEIGPVGGKTFVHGHTSVFGVFSEPVPVS
jgi:small ligand-binding sensory domain FIST